MSVAMTNCGRVGWVSDGPATVTILSIPAPECLGRRCPYNSLTSPYPPPPKPASPTTIPTHVSSIRYVPGAKLSLHQDRDEKDAWAPIVSVSIGPPAVFLWGGKRRADPVRRLIAENGDIVVWGGPARFVYHGVGPSRMGSIR